MNARQKAKKYKKELERLKDRVDPGKAVPYTVSRYDYKEYAAQIIYEPYVPTDVLKKDLIHRLVDEINEDKLVEFDIDFPFEDDGYTRRVMTARLKVLNRKGDIHGKD